MKANPSRWALQSVRFANTISASRAAAAFIFSRLGSLVVAQGAAYGRQGLDRQGYESGI